MKRILLAVCCISVATSIAMADKGKVEGSSIESCTHLLPEGRSFSFTISGTIDTNTPERELHGSFSITEDSGANGFLAKLALRPFKKCVQRLIK